MIIVTVQATSIAYLHDPRLKAFVLSLPLPFTLASLSVGRPIDATNAVGLSALLVFTHGVRLLHTRAKLHIIPSIVLPAAAYCIVATCLSRILPSTPTAFWLAAGITFTAGATLYVGMPHRIEPGHRSPLPVYIKAPLIMSVIFGIVVLKSFLGGFMTMFPMVGLITAYEARHSLWTICRQITVLMITFTPMLVTVRLTQDRLGLGGALAVGWIVLAFSLGPVTYCQLRNRNARVESDG